MRTTAEVMREARSYCGIIRSNELRVMKFGEYGIEALVSLLPYKFQEELGVRSHYSPADVGSFYLRGRMRGELYAFINVMKQRSCVWGPEMLRMAERIVHHMRVYMWFAHEDERIHNITTGVNCSSKDVYLLTVMKRLAEHLGVHDAVLDSKPFQACPQ